MVWESIIRALSGPLLAKLFFATLLLLVYLALRPRDAEGRMGGFALLALALLLRDLLYAFFPLPSLFLASDLLLAGLLATALVPPARRNWPLWLALGLDLASLLLLCLISFFGLFPALSPRLLALGALPPLVFLALGLLSGRAGSAASPASLLGLILEAALSLGLALYLLASSLLGPASFVFQALATPLFYGLLLLPAFFAYESRQRELVAAVEYYEESIDSLYELLMATGSAIKAGFTLQEVLDGMIGVVVNQTGAEGGLVILAEEAEEAVAVRALTGRFPPPFKLPESLPRDEERVHSHFRHARFRLGEGLFGELIRSGTALFVPEAWQDPRIPRNGEEDWLRLHSLIAAPLVMRDRVIGAVAASRVSGRSFDERDFDRLKLLANFGSIAVSNAYTFLEAAERGDIEREAAIAEDIQRGLLPRKLPELPGFSMGASSIPARGVCSDYYDLILTRADRGVLAFGDVAGKGVSAGLVMVMIRSMLHLVVNSTKDAATLLSWINRGLIGKVDQDHYASIGLLAIDASTGEMEFANAAQQPPLVYRKKTGTLEVLEMKSIPIGVERATEYASAKLRLEPGDLILLYSDGVVEAMDLRGRQFGRKNLGEALLRCVGLPAKEMVAAIHGEVQSYSGRVRQHDDQTLVVVKAKS